MLKDESNEIDMISPTLPCLKAILTIPVATEGRGMRDRYEKLVHGILSACLLNVDEMRCALLFFYWPSPDNVRVKRSDRKYIHKEDEKQSFGMCTCLYHFYFD